MDLQAGTIQALYNSQRANPLYKSPVLQVISFSKLVMGEAGKHRYKANLSDGSQYMKAVFSSELCSRFDSGQIKRNHLIRLGMFSVRPKEENNYLYIQTIVEDKEAPEIIGNPTNVATGNPPTDSVQRDESPTENRANGGMQPLKREGEKPVNSKRMCDSGSSGIVDIKNLNPFQSKWTIRGRVVSKSPIRKYSSATGEKKVFNFELADLTCQVNCVVFSECVDTFWPIVELNKVLSLSGGTIRMANKKFSTTGFDYEIQLESSSQLVAVNDTGMPRYFFNFTKLGELKPASGLTDVVGVVREVFPPSSVLVKSTGKEVTKRDLILADETGVSRVTFWGPRAEDVVEVGAVICLKSVKVGEYNGAVVLSTVSSSQVLHDSDIPEAVAVLAWYQGGGCDALPSIPRQAQHRSFISEVKDGDSEFVTVHAPIIYIKEENIYYEACPTNGCSKKVVQEDNGMYRCDKCNYSFESCAYRYICSAHIGDFTGQLWVSLFNEAASSLFGVPAQGLKEMADRDPQELQGFIRGFTAKEYAMRLRVKDDIYNGESKKRYVCLGISQLDFVAETKKMLEAIEQIPL